MIEDRIKLMKMGELIKIYAEALQEIRDIANVSEGQEVKFYAMLADRALEKGEKYV